jgi:hypothetical protein
MKLARHDQPGPNYRQPPASDLGDSFENNATPRLEALARFATHKDLSKLLTGRR